MAGATPAPSTLSLIFHMFQDPEQRSIAIGVWIGAFYHRETLGWDVDPKGPGYALVSTSGGLGGSLSKGREGEPGCVLGVVVSDLESVLAQAERSGGTVVMPVTDNGWVVKAQVADPAGNRLTLIQADR